MAKRSTAIEMLLPQHDKGVPAYRWLYSSLRDEILEGRLRPGTRLPATRDLASQYKLSRGTIVTAFEELKAEGYVEGSIGSGTYVSKVLPEELLEVRRETARRSAPQQQTRRRLTDYGKLVQPFPNFPNRATRAFRANLPAVDLFPVTLWAQLANRRLRRTSVGLLTGTDALGYPPLREAIAHYLTTSRGAVCTAEQVIVLSGVQEALDLSARLLLNPGDRVCMEDPGYFGATKIFEAMRAKICPLAVDKEGMKLPGARHHGARLVYTTPAHQAPLGMTMSLPRRLALLEWARRSGTLIFEDDYDGEYRYSGRPVPVLQGLDQNGVVLLAGSFSKVLFPSLRLGYMVVPLDLVDRFAAAKSLINRHSALLEQTVLCDFIAEGHLGRHLRRMREVYSERLGVLLENGKRNLAGLLKISEIEAGLQTVGWLRPGVNGREAAEAAWKRGLEVISIPGLYSRNKQGKERRTTKPNEQEGLQLGFAAIDEREIKRGVEELARVLETMPQAVERLTG
ncbi:MocR-like pyridoxine biosynthesis transcription factor PdxR [Edaphobacter bradus]|uniref:MocR-like pyridoxine biosynthesis transcription factor PdxR n=1 Tax=Edaphobacter bradus TaxID=2259016 RepID=UPI0021E0BE4E|nr:PLP-dependent aminotransferase family protein [Edaphobacter bradus]